MIRGKSGYEIKKEWSYEGVVTFNKEEYRVGDIVEIDFVIGTSKEGEVCKPYLGKIKDIVVAKFKKGFFIVLDMSEQYESKTSSFDIHGIRNMKKIEEK